jgi:hypothetical protein
MNDECRLAVAMIRMRYDFPGRAIRSKIALSFHMHRPNPAPHRNKDEEQAVRTLLA